MLSHDYFSGAAVAAVLLNVMKQALQDSLVLGEMHKWFRMNLPPLQLIFLLDWPCMFVLMCHLSRRTACFVYLLVQANYVFYVSISLSKAF